MTLSGPLTTEDALLRIQELMRIASTSTSLPRASAVEYSQCRDVLLKSELAALLPGFLLQCSSLTRFHDFIRLYHPSTEARNAFLLEAFARSRARMLPRRRAIPERTYDGF